MSRRRDPEWGQRPGDRSHSLGRTTSPAAGPITAAAGEEDDVLTATEVAAAFEEIAPRSLGLPDDELGFVFGDPATPVRRVACMWNVHTRSLAGAAAAGLNLVVCHEHPWLPDQASGWYDPPASGENRPNRLRREALARPHAG